MTAASSANPKPSSCEPGPLHPVNRAGLPIARARRQARADGRWYCPQCQQWLARDAFAGCGEKAPTYCRLCRHAKNEARLGRQLRVYERGGIDTELFTLFRRMHRLARATRLAYKQHLKRALGVYLDGQQIPPQDLPDDEILDALLNNPETPKVNLHSDPGR